MANTVKRTQCPSCASIGKDNSENNLSWFYSDKGKLINKCVAGCGIQLNQIKETKGDVVQTNINTNQDLIMTGKFEALEDRGISEDTCRKFLVQTDILNGKKIHIYNYIDKNNIIVSQKIRFIDTKEFIWRQNSNEKQLFGKFGNLEFSRTKSTSSPTMGTVYITEGELDCLSLGEIGITNTVSISTGAGNQTGNEIKRHLDFLEQFEKIVLVFDNDKVGQNTAREVLKFFTPGKGYNVLLRMFKDPNEYIKNKKEKELLKELENALLYKPENIVSPSIETLQKPEIPGYQIKYQDLNKMIKGIKLGRIYTLGAGSGCGKSTFTKEILVGLLKDYPNLNVGAVYLEEPVKSTALSFIALDNDIPAHELEDSPLMLKEKFKESYDKFIESQRIHFVDASFMKLESKELINTLNYLVLGLKCNIIVLDHLTMVTYDMQGDHSERKDIDMLMKALRELTYRTNCSIILVSHLKRPAFGKSWAEGKEVNMTDLRGSAGLEQLSDVIIGLERNMIDENEKLKTRVKVLKNRITGQTGYCDDLFYEQKTGRLITINQLFS